MVGQFNVKYLVGNFKEYNGKKYYDVTVMQTDDVKKLSCDEMAFNVLKGHEMQDVVLHVDLKEFSSEKGMQRSFKVVGAEVSGNAK